MEPRFYNPLHSFTDEYPELVGEKKTPTDVPRVTQPVVHDHINDFQIGKYYYGIDIVEATDDAGVRRFQWIACRMLPRRPRHVVFNGSIHDSLEACREVANICVFFREHIEKTLTFTDDQIHEYESGYYEDGWLPQILPNDILTKMIGAAPFKPEI